MHAITFKQPGGPDVLEWTTVATPDPGPGEVRLRVIAAGVNPADARQREGKYPPPAGASEILGLECSGVVDAVGDDVLAPQMGDTVVALLAGGAYAEQVVVPAAQCVALPDGVDAVESAGLMEAACTVVSNLDAVRLAPGETVLVHGGAGSIGGFAIQYCKAIGCRVIATAGSPDKLEYCADRGADEAIDYHTDWWAAVADATGGHGADVIMDVVGAPYMQHNVESLARFGRLVSIGRQQGSQCLVDLGALQARQGTITATGLRYRPLEEKAAICRRVGEAVVPLVAGGAIRQARTTRFAMTDATDAHRLLQSTEKLGKIVLVV
ncbi:MAG: NAD(P)H-quinone oxidoreductase [Propionibacteriaceae bacterium]|nr:NAD(P)H-quinone oxidoreductase [Propionibacteriaceae bacterium]